MAAFDQSDSPQKMFRQLVKKYTFPYELRDRQTSTLDSRYGDWECRSALARAFRRRRRPDELAVSGDTPIVEDSPSNAAP
jgi:hypothetical protein